MRRQALLALVTSMIALAIAAPAALADAIPPPGDGSSSGQYDGNPPDLGDGTGTAPSPVDASGSDAAAPSVAGEPAQLPVAVGPDPALPVGPPAPPMPVTAAPAPPALSKAKPTRRHRHAILDTTVASGPTVPGPSALILSSGLAVPPASAPRAVKELIWTANRLIGLPYRYGGGHASFADTAYDCSGSVSYALHAAGMISYPEDSSSLESWGKRGRGRWVTVYTNRGHAWMIVAGIRLDTSSVGDQSGLDGPRWRPALRSTRSFRVRHLAGA